MSVLAPLSGRQTASPIYDFLGAMVNHSGVYSLTRRCPILRAKRKYSARSEYDRF